MPRQALYSAGGDSYLDSQKKSVVGKITKGNKQKNGSDCTFPLTWGLSLWNMK